MSEEAKAAPDPNPQPDQTLAAVGLLVVLFCAFFWLGFHAGKISVPRPGAAAAPETPSETVEQPAVPAEPAYRQKRIDLITGARTSAPAS